MEFTLHIVTIFLLAGVFAFLGQFIKAFDESITDQQSNGVTQKFGRV